MEPEKTRIVICLVIVIGFFAVIAAYVYYPIKGDLSTMNLLVGALISAFTGVVNYFCSSTSGSKAKDSTIADIAKAAVPVNSNVPPTNVTPLGKTGS